MRANVYLTDDDLEKLIRGERVTLNLRNAVNKIELMRSESSESPKEVRTIKDIADCDLEWLIEHTKDRDLIINISPNGYCMVAIYPHDEDEDEDED